MAASSKIKFPCKGCGERTASFILRSCCKQLLCGACFENPVICDWNGRIFSKSGGDDPHDYTCWQCPLCKAKIDFDIHHCGYGYRHSLHMDAYEITVEDMHYKVDELHQQIAELQHALVQKGKVHSTDTYSLQAKDERYKQLQDEMRVLKSNVTRCLATVGCSVSALDATATVDIYEGKMRKMQEQHRASIADYELKIASLIATKDREYAQLKSSFETSQAHARCRYDDLVATNAALHDDYQRLQSMYDGLEKTVSERLFGFQAQSADVLEQKLASLNAEMLSLQSQIATLQTENATLLDAGRKMRISLQAKIQDLETKAGHSVEVMKQSTEFVNEIREWNKKQLHSTLRSEFNTILRKYDKLV